VEPALRWAARTGGPNDDIYPEGDVHGRKVLLIMR
jgi:hypothetical protein